MYEYQNATSCLFRWIGWFNESIENPTQVEILTWLVASNSAQFVLDV